MAFDNSRNGTTNSQALDSPRNQMLSSDTAEEFDPDRNTWNSRDYSATNYSIVFGPREVTHPQSGCTLCRKRAGDGGESEFGGLDEIIISIVPEGDSTLASRRYIDNRDFYRRQDDAYDYPLGVEVDELQLPESETWDAFDDFFSFEGGHCAEVDSRESYDNEGFHACDTSIRYFDATDIYDQEEDDAQMVVYEEAEEGSKEQIELVNITVEEFHLRTTAWSFYSQKGLLEFTFVANQFRVTPQYEVI